MKNYLTGGLPVFGLFLFSLTVNGQEQKAENPKKMTSPVKEAVNSSANETVPLGMRTFIPHDIPTNGSNRQSNYVEPKKVSLTTDKKETK